MKTDFQWGHGCTPVGSDILRAAADRMDEVLAVIMPDSDYLPDDDWRWGVQVKVSVEDAHIGVIRPHEDGFFGMYFEEGGK